MAGSLPKEHNAGPSMRTLMHSIFEWPALLSSNVPVMTVMTRGSDSGRRQIENILMIKHTHVGLHSVYGFHRRPAKCTSFAIERIRRDQHDFKLRQCVQSR